MISKQGKISGCDVMYIAFFPHWVVRTRVLLSESSRSNSRQEFSFSINDWVGPKRNVRLDPRTKQPSVPL